jgi:hypothetical protein
VQSVSCRGFDPKALDLLAVKYMICSAANVDQMAGWDLIAREKDAVLFKRSQYDGGILLFCNWHITPASPPMDAREGVLKAFADGVALIASETADFTIDRDPACPSGGGLAQSVDWTEQTPGAMTLTIVSPHSGVLLIPDNFDSGWQASINGSVSPLLKVYGSYVGIPVTSGRSTIRLVYRDDYFWIGLALSGLTLLGLFIYVGVSYARGAKSDLSLRQLDLARAPTTV